ncbi:hypothetical protein BJV82DRAFT_287949 [Fennellomyces sp. T-0311]|nr:hypothetical protein BJV82DRAFT_287949 [Fennellomyces sp. T-0311]
MDSLGSFGQSPIFGGRDPGDLLISPSTSTSQLDGLTTGEEDEAQQRNLQEMFEKRRRRRESHNAVERRRRENINDRIHELCMLLPERLLELAPASSNVMSVSTNQNGGNTRAVNKGTVLKLSIDHIKELQTEVCRYREKIEELEQKIGYLKSRGHISEGDLSNQTQHRDDSQYPGFFVHRAPHGAASVGAPERERMNPQQFQRQSANLHMSLEELARQL